MLYRHVIGDMRASEPVADETEGLLEILMHDRAVLNIPAYPDIRGIYGLNEIEKLLVEKGIYEKFVRGEVLSCQEARFLLPERAEFVELWRWLERQSAQGTVVEDTLPRIARGVSRTAGRQEIPARTMVCLEVLKERGLISLEEHTGRYQITIRHVEEKVDLEASRILCRLREALRESEE